MAEAANLWDPAAWGLRSASALADCGAIIRPDREVGLRRRLGTLRARQFASGQRVGEPPLRACLTHHAGFSPAEHGEANKPQTAPYHGLPAAGAQRSRKSDLVARRGKRIR